MFNTYKLGSSTNNVNFNAPCVGTLQKSHPKSKFIRFHKNSEMAKIVFSERPSLEKYKSEITVLQIMVFGDNEILIEYVLNDDLIEETK